jgi:hypothetical protein
MSLSPSGQKDSNKNNSTIKKKGGLITNAPWVERYKWQA